MITVTPSPLTTPPATSPAPPAAPDLAKLAEQFTSIATRLTASDETLTKMVADVSPVGSGWGPHMSAIAGAVQSARDELLVAKPDVAADLGAKLGADVLKLSEAAGSLTIMARQRAVLSDGWASFLDTAIADATAAATLLAPSAKDPVPAPAVAAASERATAPQQSVGQPGDIDYCQTPGLARR